MAEAPHIMIDPSEQFEHLPHAPIVEAIIEIRARAESLGNVNELKESFEKTLPEYSKINRVGQLSFKLPVDFAAQKHRPEMAEQPKSEQTWLGLRLETEDGRNVAQLTRDFFSFSRLKPYENWEKFQAEAIRLWKMHAELTAPSDITRLGVRFINRLEVPAAGLELNRYLKGLTDPLNELPRSGFFHRDTLSVPNHSYGVTLIRTNQPASAASEGHLGLLIDIDVSCQDRIAPDIARIERRLADMRWLKNKVFFANVKEKALELCR